MIRLREVSLHYPGAARPALSRVSLELSPGQLTVVTGAVGAGCSSLLLVAAGLAPHLTGGALDGEAATLGVRLGTAQAHAEIAGRVALLLPTPWSMLSGVAFSVRDEVAFGPANLGWPRERIRHAVDAALELTGTVHLAERDPATLSGGELQRVMLAGVVALEPEVLLLDEPTAELDAEGTERFYHLARALAQAATVLIATTDVDRAAGVAGRVVVLERGRVVADGSPADALGDPRVVAVDCSTSAAVIARDAGFAAPYPVTVDALLTRVAH